MALVYTESFSICRVPCACVMIFGDGEDEVTFLAEPVKDRKKC